MTRRSRLSLVRRDWHRGRAVVVGPPSYPEGRGSGPVTVTMRLSVLVRGRDRYELEYRCRAPGDKLPARGHALPVRVDPDDPSRIRIEWDEAPTLVQRAGRAIDRPR